MLRIFLRIGIPAVLLSGVVAPVFADAPPAQAAVNCTASIDNPHYSTGAGGVIAKGNWKCALVPSDIEFTGGFIGFNLWLCTDKSPTRTESYLTGDSHCSIKGTYATAFEITVAGQTYVRYVPPSGQSGAHGTGWWVACAVWESVHNGVVGSVVTTFSNVWEGSG
jgi:hypothetical protein